MSLKPWLLIALGELGEAEGGNNPRIDEYLKSVGLPADDQVPWCASFVNWCLEQCGLKGTGLGNAKSYMTYGIPAEGYSVGSILVFNRGSDPAKGHVAFCLQVNSNGTLYRLGGNQGNRVSVECVNQSEVVAARLPKELA